MLIVSIIWLVAVFLIRLCERKERKYPLSEILLLLLIILMMGGTYGNADWQAYKIRYQESASGNFITNPQWAQSLFGYLCNLLGLNYDQYRLVYVAVGVLLIYRVFKRYTDSAFLPLIFYMISPMIIDATQLKNFMMMAILANALPCLVDGSLKSKIKYILLVVLAAGFQITGFAYLPLVIFCDTGCRTKYRALSVLPIIVLDVLLARKSVVAQFYSTILTFLNSDTSNRMSSYGQKQVSYGYLVYWLATFLIFFMLHYAKKMVQKAENSDEKKKIIDVAYMCSIYSFAFFPLHLLTIDFSRLFRNFAIMNHVAISNALQRGENVTAPKRKGVFARDKTFLAVSYFVYLLYLFRFDIAGYMDTVVIPFFSDNWIF